MSESLNVGAAFYNVPQTAKRLAVSTRKVWRMLSQGVFNRIIVPPKGTRIAVAEVEAYITSLTAKATEGAR